MKCLQLENLKASPSMQFIHFLIKYQNFLIASSAGINLNHITASGVVLKLNYLNKVLAFSLQFKLPLEYKSGLEMFS